MASDDERSPEESQTARIDPTDYLDRPHLHSLRITRTGDAVVLSGRVESADPKEVLRLVEELLSKLAGGGVEDSGSDAVKESRSDPTPEDSAPKSADSAFQDEDVLNGDDLIPVAPARPGGRIRVRVKKAQRDKPAPAEDPWAK